jgi:hypothetical protein
VNLSIILLLLLTGWLIGWALKYVIFGLDSWDSLFHPERQYVDDHGPFKMFARPFLGVFSA